MNTNHRKLIFALIGVFLMTSGVFSLISYIPGGTIGVNQASPALSNVGETAGTSIGVNYWTNGAVANSGTTTVDLPAAENSSYTTVAFSTIASWNFLGTATTTTGAYINQAIPFKYFYTNSNTNTVELSDVAFNIGTAEYYNGANEVYNAVLYKVYANLSLDGFSYSWSWTPNYQGTATSVAGDYNTIAFIDPQWNIYPNTPANEWSGTTSVNFTAILGTSESWSYYANPDNIVTTGYQAGTNTIIDNPASFTSNTQQPFAIGYYFQSESTSFTIPQYESSFDLTWSSSYTTNPQYNSQSPSSTSGTLTGSLTSNSFTIYPSDPAVSGISDITFSYDLSSQYQVSNPTTTETPDPTYTYTQVSGTTNQASASFNFGGTTPSTAVFIPYESGTSSLATDTSNIVFTPTITVSNPYSTYTQNQLVASLTGTTSGSSTTSNTASPSFTGNSITYTSAASPSWTVNLNLYGNVAPAVSAPTITFQNSGSEISTTFTISQSVFNGELQDIVINWGDGTTTSYNNLAPNTYTYYHNYTGTYQGTFSQTYSPYITDTNVPNPASNGLSGLTATGSSTSYTFGMVDNPTTPDSILKVGQSIYMNITATNLMISGATVSVNGLSPSSATLKQSGNIYDFKFSSTLFGVSGVTIKWTIDPAGIIDTFSTQYATPIEPTIDSSDVTALFSNSATKSYGITLSGVPSGTGFYQQLLTISNPSSYGINTAGSNVQFTASNGTLLYAWIQSINSTSMQVWVKNYYGNSVIDMQVLPAFENLFSENGYLGYEREYFNARNVFIYATDFANLNGWNISGLNGGYANITTNGLELSSSGSTSTINSNLTFSIANPVSGLADVPGYGAIGYVQDINGIGYTSPGWFDTGTGVGEAYYALVSDPGNSYGDTAINGVQNEIGSADNMNNQTFSVWYSPYTFYADYSSFGLQNYVNSTTIKTTGYHIMIGASPRLVITVPYIFVQSINDTAMPTISSIGTGSVFQANATADNTTSQHYGPFGKDSTNLTDGEYTYSIPDSFNSNYITIYYNPAWTIDYASYGFATGVQATSSGSTMPYLTFAGVSGIGKLTMTFTEPLVIGEPLGTLSLGVLPSIAVDGNAFFELPNDLLNWKANGVPVNPTGFSVVVGKPVLIQAFSAGAALVFNQTYTPTEEVTFLQTYVNITAFQFNNLNSTDEVQISATNSQNVTQHIAIIAPYGTGASSQTVYLPSGSYTFKYTELNYTTGQVISGTSTATAPLASYNGEYWVTLSGFTIFQLGNQLKYTNSSIQKSFQSLSVIIALNYSEIKNLTLGVDLNLTTTNTSIQNVLQKVLVSDKFINDTILNENTSLQARFDTTNSIIHTFESNITVLDTYTNDTVNTINKIITTVNTNLTTANSVIGEIKIIDTQNFTALNSTVKSNYLKLISAVRKKFCIFHPRTHKASSGMHECTT